MPSASDTASRVSRVVTLLNSSDDADATWFGEALALWLAGADLAAALGLADGWRLVVAQRRQEAALTALVAATGLPSCRAAAREIEQRLARYQATAWRADSAAGRRPGGTTGLLYDHLAAGGAASFGSLRRKLSELHWLNEADDLSHPAA